MSTDIDTGTNYNLLINTFKDIFAPYKLATGERELIVQLEGVVTFHFDFQGNYVSYKSDPQ